MKFNPAIGTDSYKLTHHDMYPTDLQEVYSYFEARKPKNNSPVVLFGLRQILKDYLVPVTRENIEEAKELSLNHFGNDYINEPMWNFILERYNGRIPLEIKAIPEGHVCSHGNALVTVRNLDPICSPLVNHFETLLSHYWYPCTVASKSFSLRILFEKFAKKCGYTGPLDYHLHDFGFRGASSYQSAQIGSAAHLLSFNGTDTLAAYSYIKEHYGERYVGNSVPASEHSVMTITGPRGEADAIQRILNKYPDSIVSVVSDSYDIYNSIDNLYGDQFKDQIQRRAHKLVVRPDSGNPLEVLFICLQKLASKFGHTVNAKGYKELPANIGLIWGDGLSYDTISAIIERMDELKWSISNCVFGMGGGLLQNVNRDDLSFAFKASNAIIGGLNYKISKNPIHGSKKSKSGKFIVQMMGNDLITTNQVSYADNTFTGRDYLETVYTVDETGYPDFTTSFPENFTAIKNRVRSYIPKYVNQD